MDRVYAKLHAANSINAIEKQYFSLFKALEDTYPNDVNLRWLINYWRISNQDLYEYCLLGKL